MSASDFFRVAAHTKTSTQLSGLPSRGLAIVAQYFQYDRFLTLLQKQRYQTCFDVYGNNTIEWSSAQKERYASFVDQLKKTMASHGQFGLIQMEGNSALYPDQYRIYSEIAKLDLVRTVCETGFNAGHSALMWLNGKPNTVLYSFDIAKHSYVMPMVRVMKSLFPGRLHFTPGDSTESLPHFIKKNPHVNCDLVVIDGGHSGIVPKLDFENLKKMVIPGSLHMLLIDDLPSSNSVIKNMWNEKLRSKEAEDLFHCQRMGQEKYGKGFTIGKFLFYR